LWTTICLISGSSISPTHCQPVCLSSLCLLKVCTEIMSLPFPPSLVPSEHPDPSVTCLFSVPCLLFHFFAFIFAGGGQSVQWSMLVYPRGSCGNTACHLFALLLVHISQADLALSSGSAGALLFSQCNVVWRSFVQVGGSGCQSFDSSWCFFFCQMWF
jgi:hypothetical protein